MCSHPTPAARSIKCIRTVMQILASLRPSTLCTAEQRLLRWRAPVNWSHPMWIWDNKRLALSANTQLSSKAQLSPLASLLLSEHSFECDHAQSLTGARVQISHPDVGEIWLKEMMSLYKVKRKIHTWSKWREPQTVGVWRRGGDRTQSGWRGVRTLTTPHIPMRSLRALKWWGLWV